jgi:hypothetical protein
MTSATPAASSPRPARAPLLRPVALAAALLSAAALVAGCKSAGMGAETRADIAAQMRTAEGPIQACYASALKRNRRIQGRMSVRMVAEASTGQLKGFTVLRDEPGDQAVRECVLAELGKLKLAKPTKASVQIDQPILFAPNR